MCRANSRCRPVRRRVATATEEHQVPLFIEDGTEGWAADVGKGGLHSKRWIHAAPRQPNRSRRHNGRARNLLRGGERCAAIVMRRQHPRCRGKAADCRCGAVGDRATARASRVEAQQGGAPLVVVVLQLCREAWLFHRDDVVNRCHAAALTCRGRRCAGRFGLGMGAQLLVVCLGAPTHHCEEGVVWSAQVERGDRTTLGRVDL